MIFVDEDRHVVIEGSGIKLLAELAIVFSVIMDKHRDDPEALKKIKTMLKTTVDFAADLNGTKRTSNGVDMDEARAYMEEILKGGKMDD